MCPIQIKLTGQHTAAELAYHSGIARMKRMRGQEFQRALLLVEHWVWLLFNAPVRFSGSMSRSTCAGFKNLLRASPDSHVRF